jgi:methyl-accepting chemotaxis protein
MNAGTLPSSAGFRWRIVKLTLIVSAVGMAVVLASLYALLDLTSDQWTWFLGMIAAYTAVTGYPNLRAQYRLMAPVTDYLDRRDSDADLPQLRRGAFGAVMDLPRRNALLGAATWILPNLVIGSAMMFKFSQWGIYEFVVIVLAGIAVGFVSGSVLMFVTKSITRTTREALTTEVPDPSERRALIRPLPLRAKMLVCVTGMAIVPVVFAVLLARSQAAGAFETFTIGWQNELLDTMEDWADSEELAGDYEAAEGAVMTPGSVFPAPVEITILDLKRRRGEMNGGYLEEHVVDHLRGDIRDGVARGSSVGLPSENVFAWRLLSDGRVLLASTPVSALRVDAAGSWLVYTALILGAMAIALGLAHLIASDVSRTAHALQAEADRMASGDLRQGRVFESEDELGDLSRSFEKMTHSLRSTVGRVAEAADRVEGTAGEMASIAESVATVTASQVTGIREAARSMEAIDRQVKDIADSSQALNVSVEESSSTILELGAAGEELNDTASVLSTKVGEVSSSIEQMVASVKQVSENTEALSHAAVETSTSMEEMVSSMREVDTSAEQTARLSHDVVKSAENGQTKVRQTIDGMNAIREATETAEKVIQSLGKRTKEIGAIVDVIDDVADETNLLALNAAIIAAQAGEHGRAFSVVADEIKDLADRVLASTKEIGSLISSVQEESGNAIGAIEQGTRSVAAGVDLSAEAGVSLETITAASRDSGTRIGGIVAAVREQAKAASHVAELMERVRSGVDEIRSASTEQGKGNEVVYRGAVAMREVAQQVRGTTEEQARGSGRIRESVDGVRDAVEQINSALQEQSAACRSVVEFLEEVSSRTQSNEVSARRMDEATKELLGEAAGLREEVHQFQV